ncbi:MAG: hypothetical protein GQ570_09065 [Helicobacteraceae bacterium]|nr:hypothetical protein [Helicobacteraceae bacterium]
MHYKKLGPFITQAIKHDLLLHTSRSLRKSLHKPKSISWWISVLFMIGSSLFALPTLILTYPHLEVMSDIINTIYFIGSLFFTSAAYLQYLESINSDITNSTHVNMHKDRWLWFRYRPHNLGYLSSLTQLIGTLFFNMNTLEPLLYSLSITQSNMLIWTPNMLGSILFLTSSFFAWLEVFHDGHVKAFKTNTWWIIWINILGSIFFQLSALYSFNFASGDNSFFDSIAEWTTFWGALCFFSAALLLRFEKNFKS